MKHQTGLKMGVAKETGSQFRIKKTIIVWDRKTFIVIVLVSLSWDSKQNVSIRLFFLTGLDVCGTAAYRESAFFYLELLRGGRT